MSTAKSSTTNPNNDTRSLDSATGADRAAMEV